MIIIILFEEGIQLVKRGSQKLTPITKILLTIYDSLLILGDRKSTVYGEREV